MNNLNNKMRSAGLTFLLLAGASLFAENAYTIADEIYEIPGRTRESALLSVLGNAEGMTFGSKEELEAFVAARAQKMENLRSFKKSGIEIVYPETPNVAEPAPDPSAAVPVTLKVSITDGTPFFPIPYAFYNSNDGFQAGTLLTVPNIAGSLQDLLFIGLYTAPPDENDKLQWTNPNFMMLATWSGIRVKPFELGFSGIALKLNQLIEDRGVPVIKTNSLQAAGTFRVTYPFSDRLSDTVSLRLGGSPQNTIIYNDDPDFLSYGPISFSKELKNTVSYTDVDWIGNFRDGIKASVSTSYAVYEPRYADEWDDLMAEVEFAGYYAATDRFNPNFRVYSFVNSGLPQINPAGYIRGIRNTELKGNTGVFVNTGLQTKLFRFGTAELHLTPGVDWAFVHAYEDPDYTTENGFGVGTDLVLVFDAMKTFPIKLGVAYDLRPKYGDDIGNRIEVDFNFSFAY